MSETRTEAKIITVTLNPSLDRTLVTHFLALGYHNWTRETTRLDISGRSISISRALYSLGVPTHAVVLIGHDATGRAYQALLAEEQFPISVLRREGLTRSTIIIKDTGHQNETQVSEDSSGVNPHDLRLIADLLQGLVNPGDTVVFAGSLPGDTPTDTYAVLTDIVQSAGAQVAVNAGGGEPLKESLKARPDFVYLTQLQAEGLFNFPVRVPEDVIHCAQTLREQGAGTALITMLQSQRAILVADEGVWMAEWPEVEGGTHSGMEEAMIAGTLAGMYRQQTLDEVLKLGAAAATYTGLQVGHEFGTARDISEQADAVAVMSVDDVNELRTPDS
jgi:1-phosphofructokinase family hexose kinase